MRATDATAAVGTPLADGNASDSAAEVTFRAKPARIYYGWILLVAVMLMSFSAAGARFSFGVFIQPMRQDLGWELTQLSGAASINLLLAGLLRWAAGLLADRIGARAVVVIGLAVAALALAISSVVTEYWQFMLAFGVLLAVGYAFASPVTTTPLVSAWFHGKRALALSIASTGGALGELVTVPMAALLVGSLGWQLSFQAIAAFIGLFAVPVAFLFIRNRPQDLGLRPYGETETSSRGRTIDGGTAITPRQAATMPDIWRLTFGFFVCGFTMSFAQVHFVPFAMEMGFESMVAASTLGLVGLFSIGGSLATGSLADRLGRKNILAVVYLLRGSSFLILMHAHHNPLALYSGAFLLGVSWTSTTPLTSSITADRCGLPNLGTIFGTMFTIMPIGTALGTYLAGYLREASGTYDYTLLMSAIAGIAASIAIAGVREPKRPKRAA
ncbi:MAG: MFS transporter [Chloroflexi bacterium]|nr:MFS transporter [Chloroflexota bacterium]